MITNIPSFNTVQSFLSAFLRKKELATCTDNDKDPGSNCTRKLFKSRFIIYNLHYLPHIFCISSNIIYGRTAMARFDGRKTAMTIWLKLIQSTIFNYHSLVIPFYAILPLLSLTCDSGITALSLVQAPSCVCCHVEITTGRRL